MRLIPSKAVQRALGVSSLQAIAKDIWICGYNDDLHQAILLAEQLLPCAEATMAAIRSNYSEWGA